MSRPAYTIERCSCERPHLTIQQIQYQRGSGLVDFFCASCGKFRISKALDDLKPYSRGRVRDLLEREDGEVW